MIIRNYHVTDKTGQQLEIKLADMKAQADAGQSFPFQVISDSDTVAVYRQIEQLDTMDAYMGRWWRVDLLNHVITSGHDQAMVGSSVDYKDNIINCTGVLDEYQII